MVRYWLRHNALAQPRRGGRFTGRTLENTFGLKVDPCLNPECGALNPRGVGQPAHEKCPKCGGPVMGPSGEAR